ncbi:hypothetical protein [Ectobacillus funiculus]|nr:hypothetical protein [Ectobacillus funiculus]
MKVLNYIDKTGKIIWDGEEVVLDTEEQEELRRQCVLNSLL